MLFPTDPEKRPELWRKFTEKMTSGKIALIVHRGKIVTDANHLSYSAKEVDQMVNSFRSADVVRFGAERGQAIGPFFALKLVGRVAQLVEYAIDPDIQSESSAAIQEAIQSLSINLFFESRNITGISIPFVLARWEIDEWSAVMDEGGTTLQRRS
jgi:hypothetical protein